MIKLTLFAHYEELIDLGNKTFKEHNEHENIISQNLLKSQYELEIILVDDIGKILNRIDKIETDVIMARGVDSIILKNIVNVPVVEIPIAGIDISRCLYESKHQFGDELVGIVASKNMTYGISEMSEILGANIRIYSIESFDHIPIQIENAIKDNCKVIIGGSITCSYCKQVGYDYIFIKTGRESLWQAISEAKRVAYISRQDQKNAQLFKTVLDNSNDGIIALDPESNVTIINQTAKDLLNISPKELMSKSIYKIIKDSRLINIIEDSNGHNNEIVSYNDVQLAVNKIPIILRGSKVGNLLTFQDVTKIQEVEGKIREKLYSRGHIAKYEFEDIIGESSQILNTIEIAKKFSKTESNILIHGETGVGKELFAQSIHNESKRKNGPFIAINCAALPESLLDSELFGYVGGAFSGASKSGKIGMFELAHRGTIFLDEISEVSLALQGRLLRVLQEKEIMRLGADKVIPIDVRIVSATNKDLFNLVKEGKFREDLYYRLDVLKLNIPTLHQRREDIPVLVENFIYSYNTKNEKLIVTDEAMELLSKLDWPGNVRELENACERLAVLSTTGIIDTDLIYSVLYEKTSVLNKNYSSTNSLEYDNKKEISNILKKYDLTNVEVAKELERKIIIEALEKEGYNKTKTAERMGISRTTLWKRMKELEMD